MIIIIKFLQNKTFNALLFTTMNSQEGMLSIFYMNIQFIIHKKHFTLISVISLKKKNPEAIFLMALMEKSFTISATISYYDSFVV